MLAFSTALIHCNHILPPPTNLLLLPLGLTGALITEDRNRQCLFCPEKNTTCTLKQITADVLRSPSIRHRHTFIFSCDEYGGHGKEAACTSAQAHYIVSTARNTVTQYLKFPLSRYPPRRSTLGSGLMTY